MTIRTNRLKLAFVTPGSFPVPSFSSSSVEQVTEKLSRKLAAWADCTVYGIRCKGYPYRERQHNVRYIRPTGRNGYWAGVTAHLKREYWDVIQVENRPRGARTIKKALPYRRVWLSLHSLTFVTEPQISLSELASCFRRVDRILVNSEFLREEIVKLVPSASHKLIVNHLGVEMEQFPSRWTEEGIRLRLAKLEELGYQDKKIVLYVGRLIPLKGVHHLFEALPSIVSREPDTVLIVVGSASYGTNRITNYVAKLHQEGSRLPNHVRFIPFTPHDQISDWYRLADVVVVPTPKKEAFGLVNLEAMASGVPVIAAAAGGLREIIEDGKTGFLIPEGRLSEGIGEGVCKILADKALAQRLGEAAVNRIAENFTWDAAARRWLDLAAET